MSEVELVVVGFRVGEFVRKLRVRTLTLLGECLGFMIDTRIF